MEPNVEKKSEYDGGNVKMQLRSSADFCKSNGIITEILRADDEEIFDFNWD
jgi:hypothetical protein